MSLGSTLEEGKEITSSTSSELKVYLLYEIGYLLYELKVYLHCSIHVIVMCAPPHSNS